MLAAGWGITLALLAMFTANPVMLNREQILGSRYVVTATVVGRPVLGPGFGRAGMEKARLAGTITVENLAEAGERQGSTYVIPLSRPYDAFRVTESPFPVARPLMYPATSRRHPAGGGNSRGVKRIEPTRRRRAPAP